MVHLQSRFATSFVDPSVCGRSGPFSFFYSSRHRPLAPKHGNSYLRGARNRRGPKPVFAVVVRAFPIVTATTALGANGGCGRNERGVVVVVVFVGFIITVFFLATHIAGAAATTR